MSTIYGNAIIIPSSGGAEPATLTITSQSYTGNQYGLFVFVNSEGHLKGLNYDRNPFTFPITIKTVIGGLVTFIPSELPGIPSYRNPIGCEHTQYRSQCYFLVTSPQASVEIYDSD